MSGTMAPRGRLRDLFIVGGLLVLMFALHFLPRLFGFRSVGEISSVSRGAGTLSEGPAAVGGVGVTSITQAVEETRFRVAAEEMPTVVGGDSALAAYLVYPDLAKRMSVEGVVFVLAYIDTAGSVVKTSVLRGIGGGCDEAACDAVSALRFVPGREHGSRVAVKEMIPVRFSLSGRKS